jgi:hypothetical protein
LISPSKTKQTGNFFFSFLCAIFIIINSLLLQL